MFEVASNPMISIIGLIFLAILGVLVLLKKKEETGHWVVAKGDEFLIFHGPANWSTTSIPEHADKFNDHADADAWARYIGGKVMPWSEVAE